LEDLNTQKRKIYDEISKLNEIFKVEASGGERVAGSVTEQRGKALLAVTLVREEIVCITNEQWSLVTETENASRALEVAMCAVLTLLGLHGVTTWSSVKDALQAENANIFQRIRECKLQDIVKEDCITAEALLDGIDDVQLQIENEDLEGDESGEISKVLCKWATAHIEYTSVNSVYEEIESQIAIQKVKREEIKTQIEVEYARKKTIEEEWERSLCRKEEYEWNDAHRVKDENQEEEEKQSEVNEKKVSTEIGYRPSIKNYVTIQCEDDLIAIHPTNPTFDLLSVAPIHFGNAFCNSRMYGSFFLTHGGKAIGQSPRWNTDDVHLLYRCGEKHERWDNCFAMDQSDDFKSDDIQQFTTLTYDEGFGPSGRLLVYCETANGHRLCQFLNQKELSILEESLWKCGFERPRNPGTDTKALWEYENTTICIFEMLYGTDMVELVLDRYEEARIKVEEEERKQQEIEALAPGADDCNLNEDSTLDAEDEDEEGM